MVGKGREQHNSEIKNMSHQFFFSPHILDNLHIPAAGFDVVQDISEPRLRLYITARGVKTFFTRKRVRGKDERIIIGRYPDVSIEDARAAVAEKIASADTPAPVRRNRIVFDKLFEVFMARKIKRNADSVQKLTRAAARHWAPLMKREVIGITAADLLAVHKSIRENAGAATANRMLEIMKSMFKFAVASGHIHENPAATLQKFPEVRRRVKFGASEFSRLLSAIKKEKNPAMRSAFLMLVFAFAPKSAVFSMRWRDLDFNNDTWLGRPLSDPAVVLLRNIPQSGAWVFPSRGRHLTDPRKAWANLTRSAGLPDIQMNDIYKYLSRNLTWASDREQLRQNINNVLTQVDR
jgi:hypothetical protein